MNSSQTKWLIAGLTGGAVSILAVGSIVYFFVLMVTSGSLPGAVEAATANPTRKITHHEQHRQQNEEYLALLSAKDTQERYETIAPHWVMFETLFSRLDYEAVEHDLAAQLREINDPWKAKDYSFQIESLTHFGSGGKPEDFIRIAEDWTQKRPDSHFAWLVRGGLLRAYAWHWRGDGWADSVSEEGWEKFEMALTDAVKCFEKSHSLNPKDPEISYQMLWVCIGLNAPREEFDRFFDRTVKLVPTHLNAHLAKQRLLFPKWDGSWPETESFMDECVAKADRLHFPPLTVVLFDGYHEMYHNREGYRDVFERPDVGDALVEASRAVLDAAPDSAKDLARSNYARVLYRVNRYEDALEQFEQLGDRYYAASMWDSAAHYTDCRAFAYFHRGMDDPFGDGLEDFKRAVELHVKYAGAYYYLGIHCIAEQDYDTAETLLKKAIDVEPEYAPAWVSLSSLYDLSDRPDAQVALARESKQYDFDPATRKHFTKILADNQ